MNLVVNKPPGIQGIFYDLFGSVVFHVIAIIHLCDRTLSHTRSCGYTAHCDSVKNISHCHIL